MRKALKLLALTLGVTALLPSAMAQAGEPPVVVQVNNGKACIDSDSGGGFKPNPGSTTGYSWDQVVISINPGNCPRP